MKRPLLLHLYVGGVALAATAGFVAVVLLGREGDLERPWLLPAFAALVVLENVRSTRLIKAGEQGESHAHEEALLVAMALLLPPLPALATFAVGVVLGQGLTRWSFIKVSFNIAQLVGSAALVFVIVAGIGGSDVAGPRFVLAVLLGVIVFSVVNRAAVLGVIALAGAGSFRRDFLDDLGPAALVWTGSVSLGLLAGLTGITYEWALPFALAGLVALSAAFAGHTRARRERQTLADLIHASSAAIFSVDGGGRIREWNPEMERASGRRFRAAAGRPLGEVVEFCEPSGTPARDLLTLSALSQPSQRRLVRLGASGKERWLSLSRSSLPDGGFVFVGQDMTERRKAEEALRAAEKQYRLLVEQLPLVTYRVALDDPATPVVYISPQIEALVGVSPDEWLRDPDLWAERLVHTDDRARVLADFARSRENGEPFSSEYRLVADDGRVVWVLDQATVIRDEAGGPAYQQGFLLDTTDRKRAEETLRKTEEDLSQAQKMEAVGRLAGGVAHDFNNMMSAVIGFSELVLGRLEEGDPVRAHIEEIKRAGEQASGLTSQLLAFSRKQVLQPRVLDLNTVVSETEKLLRRLIGEDVELVSVLAPDLEPVEADPGQLRQVLLNLVVNARDAMPDGGKLTIETANAKPDESSGRLGPGVEPGSQVRLTVSDTGIGMDEQTRDRVFEPFFTTKEEGRGTGLGLATVFGIVKQSGGDISVRSELGRGTTFTIFLPCTEPPPKSLEEQAAEVPPPARGSETILLVEDEETVRKLEREALAESGYTVLEARNGDEALALSEAHEGSIHLLLTDVVMPSMGGRELAQRLAPFRPEMKVLYASGYPDDAIVRHGVLEPGIAFLAKPVTPGSLARKVREVLDEAREPSGAARAAVESLDQGS